MYTIRLVYRLTLEHFEDIIELTSVLLIPSIHEIYLSVINKGADIISSEYHERMRTRFSIDKNSYKKVKRINSFKAIDSFISKDGKKLFQLFAIYLKMMEIGICYYVILKTRRL